MGKLVMSTISFLVLEKRIEQSISLCNKHNIECSIVFDDQGKFVLKATGLDTDLKEMIQDYHQVLAQNLHKIL